MYKCEDLSIDELSFGIAIEASKFGFAFRRKGWDSEHYAYLDNIENKYLFFCFKTPERKQVLTVTTEDMLAEDYEIIDISNITIGPQMTSLDWFIGSYSWWKRRRYYDTAKIMERLFGESG